MRAMWLICPQACTTLSLTSDTSHLRRGTSNLYMTGGESMGPGDLLSCLSKAERLSGDDERCGSDRSGDTHLITAVAAGIEGTTLHAMAM